jgi:hypothetical protein
LEERALEWRRFGLGTAKSFQHSGSDARDSLPQEGKAANCKASGDTGQTSGNLDPAAKVSESRPPGIRGSFLAGTGVGIPIGAAARANPFAVLAAERPGRQGQEHLLPQDVFKQKTTFLIIADFRLGGADGMLPNLAIYPDRPEKYVIFSIQRVIDRVQAAGASYVEMAGARPTYPDVIDDILAAAMLLQDFRKSRRSQSPPLLDVLAEVNDAWLKGSVITERLALKVSQGNQHRGNSGRLSLLSLW